jgi:hypothetical protein
MLTPIHQGVQGAHCVAELHQAYRFDSIPNLTIADWREHHKTIIFKDGGNSAKMRSILAMLENSTINLPWAKFNEDADTLDGLMTAVCVLVPEHIYKLADFMRAVPKLKFEDISEEYFNKVLPGSDVNKITASQYELIQMLNSCPLAK